MHKNYEDRGCALHSANYSHSSLQFLSRNASRRKRIWSTQEGSNFLLFASKISPAAEKSRSTAVDVAGAVRYLKKSFNANVRTIYCGYQGWTTHPAPQNTRRFLPLPCPAPALWCLERWLVKAPTPETSVILIQYSITSLTSHASNRVKIIIYHIYSILTDSLLLARFWQSSERDIRLFALSNEAICYNSNNIEILPIICFWHA